MCELILFYVFDGEHEHHGRGFGCGTPRCNLITIGCVVSFFSPWGSGFPHLIRCFIGTTFKVTALHGVCKLIDAVSALAAYLIIYTSIRFIRYVLSLVIVAYIRLGGAVTGHE